MKISSFVCSKIKISMYIAKGENDQRVKLLRKILASEDNKCVIVKVSNVKSKDLEVRFFNKDDAYSASLIGAYIVDNTYINISTKYLPEYASTGESGSIEI